MVFRSGVFAIPFCVSGRKSSIPKKVLGALVVILMSRPHQFRLQIYCSGESFDMGGSVVSITGGNFEDNVALEHGGAIAIWGDTTVVTVEGGTFINNSAK